MILVAAALASSGCHMRRMTPADDLLARSANEVSQAELRASGASSLLEALTRTRLNFFRARGVSSINQTPADAYLVFRDGALMGTLDVLQMMRPDEVRYVRRISAMETYHKYGRAVARGAFEIELATN
jgi:hypothetical protein